MFWVWQFKSSAIYRELEKEEIVGYAGPMGATWMKSLYKRPGYLCVWAKDFVRVIIVMTKQRIYVHLVSRDPRRGNVLFRNNVIPIFDIPWIRISNEINSVSYEMESKRNDGQFNRINIIVPEMAVFSNYNESGRLSLRMNTSLANRISYYIDHYKNRLNTDVYSLQIQTSSSLQHQSMSSSSNFESPADSTPQKTNSQNNSSTFVFTEDRDEITSNAILMDEGNTKIISREVSPSQSDKLLTKGVPVLQMQEGVTSPHPALVGESVVKSEYDVQVFVNMEEKRGVTTLDKDWNLNQHNGEFTCNLFLTQARFIVLNISSQSPVIHVPLPMIPLRDYGDIFVDDNNVLHFDSDHTNAKWSCRPLSQQLKKAKIRLNCVDSHGIHKLLTLDTKILI